MQVDHRAIGQARPDRSRVLEQRAIERFGLVANGNVANMRAESGNPLQAPLIDPLGDIQRNIHGVDGVLRIEYPGNAKRHLQQFGLAAASAVRSHGQLVDGRAGLVKFAAKASEKRAGDDGRQRSATLGRLSPRQAIGTNRRVFGDRRLDARQEWLRRGDPAGPNLQLLLGFREGDRDLRPLIPLGDRVSGERARRLLDWRHRDNQVQLRLAEDPALPLIQGQTRVTGHDHVDDGDRHRDRVHQRHAAVQLEGGQGVPPHFGTRKTHLISPVGRMRSEVESGASIKVVGGPA